ncbi:hypothetical protein ABW19_dt0201739 [Dactylella cylindrospora]|nr:hypothetical protein ABW19_dt0201739 [Dactylella cylindrospora]
MDYLLACQTPSEACYVRYLQAYANGCHILNLPFVESIAKVDFECMLRKRFFNISEDEEEDIQEAVLEAAYIPLMPAWFFERKPVTQAVRKRYQLKKPHGTQISIPAGSAKLDLQATASVSPHSSSSSSSSSSASRFQSQPRRRSCSKTAFSASYKCATSMCTGEDDRSRAGYISKSILLQIVSYPLGAGNWW